MKPKPFDDHCNDNKGDKCHTLSFQPNKKDKAKLIDANPIHKNQDQIHSSLVLISKIKRIGYRINQLLATHKAKTVDTKLINIKIKILP